MTDTTPAPAPSPAPPAPAPAPAPTPEFERVDEWSVEIDGIRYVRLVGNLPLAAKRKRRALYMSRYRAAKKKKKSDVTQIVHLTQLE